MKYQVIGPFPIHRDADGKLDRRQLDLWDEVDESLEGASGGCGVYVFGVRAGGGTMPRYVGKAERQPFRKECFTAAKGRIYYESRAVSEFKKLLGL